MKTYRLLRFAYWLAGFMPSRVMYWLCSLAGSIVYYFVPHIRRAVRDNMSHVVPQSSEKERRKISRRVIRNVYKNYYDLLRLPRMKADDIEPGMATVQGIEHLEEAVKGSKGAILFSGHLGNFALVAQIAPIRGFTTATIAEDIKPPQLYNFINKLRGTFGLKLIRMGSGQMRTIYRLLREGGVLLLAADREVSDTGARVQFFDAPADLPEGPVVLSMRLGVPLMPCVTWRLPNNKSEVRVYPAIELEKTGNYERDFAANMRKVVSILEQMISQAPDQWMVLQKVWDDGPSPAATAEQERGAESAGSPKEAEVRVPPLQVHLLGSVGTADGAAVGEEAKPAAERAT